jgi:glycosyltransferase involved in cell wall biosynthesis
MIGYLHFGGPMGDGVRVGAVREHLLARGLAFREFAWQRSRAGADMVRELASARALRHALIKVFRDRRHPLPKELNWGVEIDRWLERVALGVAQVEKDAEIDVILAESLFAGLAAAELKARRGIPFVFDMHGAVSQEAPLAGSTEWTTFAAAAERRVMLAADRVVAASPVMAEFVTARYGLSPERVSVIPNGSDVSDRLARFEAPATVVFAGNLAAYERVTEFVRAAELATGDHRFAFWLLGDGVKREALLSYTNERYVDLVYWGRRRRPDALDICARAQIGFVGQTGDAALSDSSPHQLFCPIKLFDYASCGLPTVVAPGEWAAIVERHDTGVVAASATAEAFLAAAETLLDPAVWQRKAKNARALVRDHYQWSQLLAPLGGLLDAARRANPAQR